MKFVSSLFLILLLTVSVTARKRLTRGNLREHDEGRQLMASMAKGKGSKASEAPSESPSTSKMSKGKGSKDRFLEFDEGRQLMAKGKGKGSKASEAPSESPSTSKMSKGKGSKSS